MPDESRHIAERNKLETPCSRHRRNVPTHKDHAKQPTEQKTSRKYSRAQHKIDWYNRTLLLLHEKHDVNALVQL